MVASLLNSQVVNCVSMEITVVSIETNDIPLSYHGNIYNSSTSYKLTLSLDTHSIKYEQIPWLNFQQFDCMWNYMSVERLPIHVELQCHRSRSRKLFSFAKTIHLMYISILPSLDAVPYI